MRSTCGECQVQGLHCVLHTLRPGQVMRFTCLECVDLVFALCSAQLDAQTGHRKLLTESVWIQFLHSILHGVRVGRVIRFAFVGWLVYTAGLCQVMRFTCGECLDFVFADVVDGAGLCQVMRFTCRECPIQRLYCVLHGSRLCQVM